jgi:hypothetical protein
MKQVVKRYTIKTKMLTGDLCTKCQQICVKALLVNKPKMTRKLKQQTIVTSHQLTRALSHKSNEKQVKYFEMSS